MRYADKRIQAKHITDEEIFTVMAVCGSANTYTYHEWHIWDIHNHLDYPGKVVHAKMESMIRRGILDGGGPYGCRGDYEFATAEGLRQWQEHYGLLTPPFTPHSPY